MILAGDHHTRLALPLLLLGSRHVRNPVYILDIDPASSYALPRCTSVRVEAHLGTCAVVLVGCAVIGIVICIYGTCPCAVSLDDVSNGIKAVPADHV